MDELLAVRDELEDIYREYTDTQDPAVLVLIENAIDNLTEALKESRALSSSG